MIATDGHSQQSDVTQAVILGRGTRQTYAKGAVGTEHGACVRRVRRVGALRDAR